MLDFIRSKSASKAVMFIFGIIILVFVFWGFNPGGPSGKRNSVAVVNGTAISAESYENVYKRELDRVKSQVGGTLTDDILESLGLRQRALDMLINDILIVEEARAQGKEASDKEVQQQILSNPVFHKDGVFNKEYYFEILRQNRLNSNDYEMSLKESITAQKMWSSVVEEVSLTDDELWKEYELANSKYTFDYVSFSPSSFLDKSEASEEELKKYYDKNSFSFTVPTELKVFYARAGFDEIGKTISIPDEDILKFYEENKYDYLTGKKVKASHILIKVKDGDEAGAEKKAEAIYQRLKAGESFSKLAKAYSADPGSAARGGDLGFFGAGAMVTQFEDAAFSLAKGEMSDLVKTSFGFHIIKVTDIIEEGVRPLSEVKGDIKAVLLQAQAVFKATDAVEGLRSAFEGEGSSNLDELERVVQDAGLTATRTGSISEDATKGKILSDEMLKNAAFGLNNGGVSAPVETADGIYLIKVVERVEGHVAPLEEARALVKEAYKKEKAVQSAEAEADKVLKKLLANEPFEAVVKEHSLKVKSSGEVIREQAFIEDIGLYIGDMDGFFRLTKDEPYYAEALIHNKAFYIFRFSSVKLPGRESFDADKESIRAKYLQIKSAEKQNSWITGLREKADIKVNQDYF